MSFVVAAIVIVFVVLVVLGLSVRMVQQYEKGVVLRFGRLLPETREPGLRLIIPFADRMTKVSLQTVVMPVPPQGAMDVDSTDSTIARGGGCSAIRRVNRATSFIEPSTSMTTPPESLQTEPLSDSSAAVA